jgi:microcystin-dependent protein
VLATNIKYFLTSQNSPPYTARVEKQYLINYQFFSPSYRIVLWRPFMQRRDFLKLLLSSSSGLAFSSLFNCNSKGQNTEGDDTNFPPSNSAGTFIGQIGLFPYDFIPRFWLRCDGQVLNITQHHALFSLISTRYGGDGISTFGLPDLRGREPAAGLIWCLADSGGIPSATEEATWQGDCLVGEINLFSCGYAPHRHARCEGQLLRVSSYLPLFSLISDRFGGDGREIFGIPNLLGHGPIPGIDYYIALEGSYPGRS